jgi:hypothetical protein
MQIPLCRPTMTRFPADRSSIIIVYRLFGPMSAFEAVTDDNLGFQRNVPSLMFLSGYLVSYKALLYVLLRYFNVLVFARGGPRNRTSDAGATGES